MNTETDTENHEQQTSFNLKDLLNNENIQEYLKEYKNIDPNFMLNLDHVNVVNLSRPIIQGQGIP